MGEEYSRQVMVMGSVPHLGPIMLFDNMEDYLKWGKANGAGDAVVEKSQTNVYNNDYALHVKTRPTGATEDDVCSGYRILYRRPGKRYRFECLFAPDSSAAAKLFFIKIIIQTGAVTYTIGVAWDEENTTWQYIDSNGNYTNITGGSQNLLADQYSRVMFEWDENAGTYGRFVAGGLELDLSSLSFQSSVAAQPESLRIDIGIVAGASPPGECYVDDVLLREI